MNVPNAMELKTLDWAWLGLPFVEFSVQQDLTTLDAAQLGLPYTGPTSVLQTGPFPLFHPTLQG